MVLSTNPPITENMSSGIDSVNVVGGLLLFVKSSVLVVISGVSVVITKGLSVWGFLVVVVVLLVVVVVLLVVVVVLLVVVVDRLVVVVVLLVVVLLEGGLLVDLLVKEDLGLLVVAC